MRNPLSSHTPFPPTTAMTFSLATLLPHSKANPTPAAAPQPTARISPWLASLAYRLAHRVVMPLYFGKIQITGQENLPRSGAVLLTPTHRSRWDGLMIPYATGRWVTGRDVYFMVSANEMRGFQGWWVSRLGGFPVDTAKPGRSSIRRGVELLRRQRMLVVFPEGDIYRDGSVHPLKAGPAHMAIQAALAEHMEVQVVPIALHYSQAVPTQGCAVTIKIGKPLATGSYLPDSSPTTLNQSQFKHSTQALTADLEARLVALNEAAQGAPVAEG